MALSRDEKKDMAEQIEDAIDNLLGAVEPEDMEKAGEFLKKTVEDHIDYMIALQKMILN